MSNVAFDDLIATEKVYNLSSYITEDIYSNFLEMVNSLSGF